MVELPDIHRNADHPGLNPCKIPTEQAYGFAYRAQISAPRNNDQRILLEMPPAGYVTTILVNKRIVKKYVETFLPQTIDITDYLQNNQPTELLIKTEEHLTSALAPDGKTLFPTSAMALIRRASQSNPPCAKSSAPNLGLGGLALAGQAHHRRNHRQPDGTIRAKTS